MNDINRMLFSVSGSLDTEDVFDKIESEKNKNVKEFKTFEELLEKIDNIKFQTISKTDTNQYFPDNIDYQIGKVNDLYVVMIYGDEFDFGFGIYDSNFQLIFTDNFDFDDII